MLPINQTRICKEPRLIPTILEWLGQVLIRESRAKEARDQTTRPAIPFIFGGYDNNVLATVFKQIFFFKFHFTCKLFFYNLLFENFLREKFFGFCFFFFKLWSCNWNRHFRRHFETVFVFSLLILCYSFFRGTQVWLKFFAGKYYF